MNFKFFTFLFLSLVSFGAETKKNEKKQISGQYLIYSITIEAVEEDAVILDLNVLLKRQHFDSYKKLTNAVDVSLWIGQKNPKFHKTYRVESNFVGKLEQLKFDLGIPERQLMEGENETYQLTISPTDQEAYSKIYRFGLTGGTKVGSIGKCKVIDEKIVLNHLK